jgi:N-acetylmuramic acid 6-phosphate (MurNAc-6-P) etherase
MFDIAPCLLFSFLSVCAPKTCHFADAIRMNSGVRVTERASEHTCEIDVSPSATAVRMIRSCDLEMYSGYLGFRNCFDHSASLEALAGAMRAAMDHGGRVVFAGCGTSGRVAHLCAREFNRILASRSLPAVFAYRISGGDVSLLVSNELPEDDPEAGAADLMAALAGKRGHCVAVGITCGLSAAYVAGMLDRGRQLEGVTPVLIGFNPVALARDAPVEGWPEGKTCRSVFTALERDPRSIVLNPVLGPEPIAGSSRMKGGSMTFVLLSAAFSMALGGAGPGPRHHLSVMNAVASAAYEPVEAIAAAAELFARALKAGGKVYYLGEGTAGLIGIMDASEMVDTYGCPLDAVRGFVRGGWEGMVNNEGDISKAAAAEAEEEENSTRRLLMCSYGDFERNHAESVAENDAIVLCRIRGEGSSAGSESASFLPRWPAIRRCAGVAVVSVAPEGYPATNETAALAQASGIERLVMVEAFVPAAGGSDSESGGSSALESAESRLRQQLCLKVVLNAISTIGQVQAGKVYGNRMVSLSISNAKLLQRSIDLVCGFTSCTQETARAAILRAAHGVDQLTPELLARPDSDHIKAATPNVNALPLAILLATGMFTYSQAQEALRKDPVVARAIKQATTAT